jgi:hypothetical protein
MEFVWMIREDCQSSLPRPLNQTAERQEEENQGLGAGDQLKWRKEEQRKGGNPDQDWWKAAKDNDAETPVWL